MSNNAWRTLPQAVQQDLIGPMFENDRYRKYDIGDYQKWFKDYYQGAAFDGTMRPVHMDRYAEFRFNWRFTPEERNHMMVVYAKIKAENLWSLVSSIIWGGPCASLMFYPQGGPEAFFRHVKSHQFGRQWGSKMLAPEGVRSNRAGAELHFKQCKDPAGAVGGHIDLHNPSGDVAPGNTGLSHWWQDDVRRKATHTLAAVRAAILAQGIQVISVP